jgi:uncharacterized membrane protein YdjX (TVP38/TMEM64 family)
MSNLALDEPTDSRAVLRLAAVLLAMAASAWFFSRLLFASGMDLTPESVRQRVVGYGFWAPLAYLLLFGQPLVPLPLSVMAAAAGLAFGPCWGGLAAVAGATLRACCTFAVARVFGLAAIPPSWRRRMDRLSHSIGRGAPFRTVLLVRLIPNVPYDLQNYGLGLTGIPFGPYAAATALGILPLSLGFVYVGDALTRPGRLWPFAFGMALIALSAVLIGRRTHKRARRHA